MIKNLTSKISKTTRTLFSISAMCFLLVAIIDVVETGYEATNAQSALIEQLQEQINSQDTMLIRLFRFNIKPSHLEKLVKYTNEYGLDLKFMVGLLLVESRDNPNAQSNRHAYGLMQIQWPTAKDMDSSLVSKWQLFDPETNIRIGCQYFRWLLEWYGQDYKLAAIAYNLGVAKVDQILAEGGTPHDGYYKRIGDVE